AADAIESAVRAVMKEGAALTGDLGGNAGTSDYVDAIVAKM
ncbi:MAG: NAD-dependent isocitrate dehydrogenase, partial [Planctomycetota bacterium]|nr:NAD-dependent isocitrate dehydrogenase [Planctomycetota bacterium]